LDKICNLVFCILFLLSFCRLDGIFEAVELILRCQILDFFDQFSVFNFELFLQFFLKLSEVLFLLLKLVVLRDKFKLRAFQLLL